jgi:hypothetical protein
MFRRRRNVPHPESSLPVVLPDLLIQCQALREQTQALLREVVALTLQLSQTEAVLSRVVTKVSLSPEEFTYERRQREE